MASSRVRHFPLWLGGRFLADLLRCRQIRCLGALFFRTPHRKSEGSWQSDSRWGTVAQWLSLFICVGDVAIFCFSRQILLVCTSGTGTTAGWTVCCSPVLSGFCVESIVHRPKKISLWLGGSFVTGLLGAASSSTEA